mmetsp:Transcript_61367/g.176616  ORF Transcript_61367/g.176616 Transcript_61367/m.176616 type:complete len:464 (+) Transcript_61367:79-1470(+)
MTGALRLGWVVVALVHVVVAEPFVFDNIPAPQPFTLQTEYLFFVYAASDALQAGRGDAEVVSKVTLVPDPDAEAPASAAKLAEYRSVQIAIFPTQDFGTAIDPTLLCRHRQKDTPELNLMPAASNASVVVQTISGGRAYEDAQHLNCTAAYVLAVANCGGLVGYKLSGTIVVKNPHGYLQAVDLNKLALYRFFFLLYTALSFACLVSAFHWWHRLLHVQVKILYVSFLGVLECGLMWLFYSALNMGDNSSQALFLAGSAMSLCKICCMFRAALHASELFLRPGDEADESAEFKINFAFVAYSVADLNFRSVARHRVGLCLDRLTVFINAIPMISLSAILFRWVIVALADQKLHVKLKGQDNEDAQLLHKSQGLVSATALGAAGAVLAQLLDPSLGPNSDSWGMHCIFSDGFAQGVFAAALCGAMQIWRPSEGTQGLVHECRAASEMECQPIGAADECSDDIDS